MSANSHTEPLQPPAFDVLASAVDGWAVRAVNDGTYTPEEHARLVDALFAGMIPILGEIGGPDGRIVWYSEPVTLGAV